PGPIMESLRPAEAVRLFVLGYRVRGVHLRNERIFAGAPCLLSEDPGRLEARIFRRLYEPYWDSDSVNGRYQPVANIGGPAPRARPRGKEECGFQAPPASRREERLDSAEGASRHDHAVRVHERQRLRVGDAGELVVQLLSFKQPHHEAPCTLGATLLFLGIH